MNLKGKHLTLYIHYPHSQKIQRTSLTYDIGVADGRLTAVLLAITSKDTYQVVSTEIPEPNKVIAIFVLAQWLVQQGYPLTGGNQLNTSGNCSARLSFLIHI